MSPHVREVSKPAPSQNQWRGCLSDGIPSTSNTFAPDPLSARSPELPQDRHVRSLREGLGGGSPQQRGFGGRVPPQIEAGVWGAAALWEEDHREDPEVVPHRWDRFEYASPTEICLSGALRVNSGGFGGVLGVLRGRSGVSLALLNLFLVVAVAK